jgi:DNA-binding LytR/AlgR family response regulator
MVKVLIVEDEMPSARKLQAFINQITDDFEVLDIVDSVEDTVSFLKENEVDLIFMDIHLSDGNSFEIFDHIIVDSPIIFITAFNEYAIKAFQQMSVDYLMKPLDKDRLHQAIEKYRKVYQKQITQAASVNYLQFSGEIAKIMQGAEYQNRFLVHYRDKIKPIDVNLIASFYAESKSVFLVATDGHVYDISYTLEQLESKLNPKYFYRVNRKCIVHIQSIKDAVVYSKSKLKLNLTPELPFDVIISSEKTPRFKQWISQ